MAGFQDSFPTRMRIELKTLGDLRKEYRSKGAVRGQARTYWLMAHAFPLQGISLFMAAAYLAALHVSAFGWAGFAFSGPFLVFSSWILYRRFVHRLYRDYLKAAILQRSGSEGEAEVARILTPTPPGWKIRFGVEIPSIGYIDIVAEGPDRSAVLIEVKSHRGRISLSREEGRERLLRDGEDLEPDEDILAQVGRRLRALERIRRYRKCRAVICFSRGRLESGFPDYLGNIQVTEARDLRFCLFGAAESASRKATGAVS